MAAQWHYVINQQQAGPVELQALQQLLQSGKLSSNDLVYGPGMTQWQPASQVPALFPGGPQGVVAAATSHGTAGTLAYQGMDAGSANISPLAVDLLRQTKPWTRLIGVIMFIVAGFMLLGGLAAMVLGSAALGMRVGVGGVLSGVIAVIYIAFGALYLMPAIFLNRYASKIGDLVRTNRMGDLEQALAAQKSFWKFVGVLVLILLCLYAVVIVLMIFAGVSARKF